MGGTVAKTLWDDHRIWLVDNGVINEPSASALNDYIESVPYHVKVTVGGRGLAILAPDAFVCIEKNPVPGQADVVFDHLARG